MIGCGSSCTSRPEHRPSADPGPPLDEADIAHLSPLAQDRVRADLAAYAVSIAHHEAGHAVAGAYFGRSLRYVQTGAHPHCAYTPGTGERSERALMVCTLAGPVASASHERRILCHDPDVIAYHLTKARQGEAGRCDECHAAALLVALYPDEDDTALAHRWRAHVHDTADLLDRLDVRAAVSRVAKALHERVHLSGDQAAVLLDGATLRAGDAVFGPEDEALGDPPQTLPHARVLPAGGG